MAYVGTVAVHDGETAVSWRFASSADEGPADMFDRRGNEVLHVVQDGAPELWRLIDEWLRRHKLTTTATLIDRFHVDERLAQTCELISRDGVIAAERFEHWGRYLDRSDTAMQRICRRLDEILPSPPREDAVRTIDPIDPPPGSGVTEGACNRS